VLDSGAARHVSKVLRLGPNAPIILFDGRGGSYEATLKEVGKREVTVEVLAHQPDECESPLTVTLAQGVSKGERMDFTIQKAVELGVSSIIPISTERSVVNLKGERLEKKMVHRQGVIISACEQCGRNTLPTLQPMQSLNSWLQQPPVDHGLLLDHRATHTLSSLQTGTSATLLIGPEGGLSQTERETAYAAGFQGVRLGPRVLRTETAALAALATLQALWGDLQ
jgi:16S rRNA (uracil1498-N3)-methyltransferase